MTETQAVDTVEIPATVMPFVPMLKELVSTANGIAESIRQATSGNAEQISNLLATDERFSRFRETRQELQAKRDELETQLKEIDAAGKAKASELLPEVTGIDVESAKKEYAEIRRTKVVPLEKSIVLMFGEDVLEAIKEQHNIVPLIGVGRNSTGAVGSPKPRFDSIEVNGEEITPATISRLSAVTEVAYEDLFNAFKVAAETDNLKDVAGQVFSTAVTGPDNKVHEITFISK